ncbi:MAG: phenylacetate--CoA ligase family protein [Sandaracinaceae bacterium]
MKAEGIGPDPHRTGRRALVAAYARGAAVLPDVLWAPRLPRAVFQRRARRRLLETVLHARRHSPHYRETLRCVDLDAVGQGDLSSVPLLDKSTLRDRGERLLAKGVDPSRLAMRSSSGSSGVPTRVYFDPLRELPRRVQELRMLRAHGWVPTDRQLVFDHPGHLNQGRFLLQRMGLWRRVPYPWQAPTDEGLRFVEDGRYEVLHGVLSSLRLLALAAAARGGLRYRPKLLLSKGELLDEATREHVERALGAPLVDYYATEEVGIIAWQPPGERRYAIDADLVHVEVINPLTGAPLPVGQRGEVVVSSLSMRAMPILRYRTGDFAVLSPTPHPMLGLPMLRELTGRAMDFVLAPDGTVHHPFALLGPLEDAPELVGYRVCQTDVHRIEVHVRFKSDVPRDAVEARIREAYRARLGDAVEVMFRPLEQTPSIGRKDPLVRGMGLSADALAGREVRL